MYIWKYIHYKWINCFERFTVGLNFPRKFLNFFLYIIRYKDPASFFSIETDLIKLHIRDDMKEILMLPDATSAIKEERIKEG